MCDVCGVNNLRVRSTSDLRVFSFRAQIVFKTIHSAQKYLYHN